MLVSFDCLQITSTYLQISKIKSNSKGGWVLLNVSGRNLVWFADSAVISSVVEWSDPSRWKPQWLFLEVFLLLSSMPSRSLYSKVLCHGDGFYCLFSKRHFTSFRFIVSCHSWIKNCYVTFRKHIPFLVVFTASFNSGIFSLICLWSLKLTKHWQSVDPCYDII